MERSETDPQVTQITQDPFCLTREESKKREDQEAVGLAQVLEKLESLDQQLTQLSQGQLSVEGYVRRLCEDSTSRPPVILGGARGPEPLSPTRVERASTRSEEARSVASSYQRRSWNRSGRWGSRLEKGSSYDDARDPLSRWAKDPSFWPRKELTKLKQARDMRHVSSLDPHAVAASESVIAGRRCQAIHPDSWYRASFDLMSVILLLYDSIVIPYQFAWHLEFQGWVAIMSWLTALFWSVDLALGFVTGYYEKDGVVLDFGKVAKRYLRTGFFLNLMVVIADVGGIIIEAAKIGGPLQRQTEKTLVRLLRFVKLERVLKLSRRCRQGKVAQALDAMNTAMREKGLHEQFNITVRVCKLVFYIMWVNHLGCCIWHGIGSDATNNWFMDNSVAGTAGQFFEYMVDFYWSASILVSGGAIMTPTTTPELIMTVFCLVFGFMFTSVLISSLLSTVIEYQEINKERYAKLTMLRQFLYQHKVGSHIAVPIVRQAGSRLARKKRLSEGDVEALSVLSQSARSELWHAIYGSSLLEHSYFSACSTVDSGLVKDVCFSAVALTLHHSGEVIFEPREEARATYLVCYGSLEYLPHGGSSGEETLPPLSSIASEAAFASSPPTPAAVQTRATVTKGRWISEVALFAHWLHRGWLDATANCELLAVQPENLVKVISVHPRLIPVAQAYSSCLLQALEQEPVEVLSDLQVPVAHCSVVAAMPLPVRRLLSEGAMKALSRSASWTGAVSEHKGMAELRQEIERGDCDLMADPSGQVQRVVKIVGLRLRRSQDGALLAQIGKITDGKRVGRCQPPGTKVKVGEYPRKATERMVGDKLKPWAEDVRIGNHNEDQEDRPSNKFGVHSRYMRTLYEAEVVDPAEDCVKVLRRMSHSEAQQEEPPSPSSKLSIPPLPGKRVAIASCGAGDCTEKYNAFVFRGDLAKKPSTLFFYAWLRPEDFDALCSQSHEEQVLRWVEELDLNLGATDSPPGERAVEC